MRTLKTLSLISCLLVAAQVPAVDLVDLRGQEAELALVELRGIIETQPEDFQALQDAGIILHQLSRTQPTKDRVAEGEGYLKRARALRPGDPHASAWLGSLTTMKAMFVSDPGKQTFFVRLGTRQMDSAVRKAPDDPILRLIRGHNSMELPVFLKRTRFAVEDFERYLSLCESLECPPHHLDKARERLARARTIVAEQQ